MHGIGSKIRAQSGVGLRPRAAPSGQIASNHRILFRGLHWDDVDENCSETNFRERLLNYNKFAEMAQPKLDGDDEARDFELPARESFEPCARAVPSPLPRYAIHSLAFVSYAYCGKDHFCKIDINF